MTLPYAPKSCTLQILAMLDHRQVTQEFRNWQASNPKWREQIQAHHLGLRHALPYSAPESLRSVFRQVRNHITVLVRDWTNIPYQVREQTEGKIWVPKAEWDSLGHTQRAGRAGKNPKTSKATITFWHIELEQDVTVPVYVV